MCLNRDFLLREVGIHPAVLKFFPLIFPPMAHTGNPEAGVVDDEKEAGPILKMGRHILQSAEGLSEILEGEKDAAV